MVPASEHVTLTPFDPQQLECEHFLASQLARWAADHLDAIAACKPPMPKAARNRLGDKWRLLFQIAYVVGGDWPELVIDAFDRVPQGRHCKSVSDRSDLRVGRLPEHSPGVLLALAPPSPNRPPSTLNPLPPPNRKSKIKIQK
jgi:hypothetical protein